MIIWQQKMNFSFYLPCLFVFLFIIASKVAGRNLLEANFSASAIFIFGDSTVDPGNNNFITTPFRSNFPPYGRDFSNQAATGRFTNGRLASDFIANHVGLKDFVPAYLDPSLPLQELLTGVSFASAGSGFDPLTPTMSNVISMPKQLDYFKEYKSKLEVKIGKEKKDQLINNALFVVSAGTNDFVVNYLTMPIRRRSYSIPTYMDFVLQQAQQFVQGLLDEGARRIGVVGLPPIGCLPVVITMYSDNALVERDCINKFSSIARDYNLKLQNQLIAMQLKLAPTGSRVAYFDVYSPLEDMAFHRNYDFDVVSSGCCGTGYLEASFLCNPRSNVCPDASKYVFWDSIHPTERTYYLLYRALRPAIDSVIKN